MSEWTDEQIRLIAFKVATQYLVDKSAGKATPMTQLIEDEMIQIRDDLKARIAELEAQLAAATRWEPLPDGCHIMPDGYELDIKSRNGRREITFGKVMSHIANMQLDDSYAVCRVAEEDGNE